MSSRSLESDGQQIEQFSPRAAAADALAPARDRHVCVLRALTVCLYVCLYVCLGVCLGVCLRLWLGVCLRVLLARLLACPMRSSSSA